MSITSRILNDLYKYFVTDPDDDEKALRDTSVLDPYRTIVNEGFPEDMPEFYKSWVALQMHERTGMRLHYSENMQYIYDGSKNFIEQNIEVEGLAMEALSKMFKLYSNPGQDWEDYVKALPHDSHDSGYLDVCEGSVLFKLLLDNGICAIKLYREEKVSCEYLEKLLSELKNISCRDASLEIVKGLPVFISLPIVHYNYYRAIFDSYNCTLKDMPSEGEVLHIRNIFHRDVADQMLSDSGDLLFTASSKPVDLCLSSWVSIYESMYSKAVTFVGKDVTVLRFKEPPAPPACSGQTRTTKVRYATFKVLSSNVNIEKLVAEVLERLKALT